jgi:hypothetical protein
VNHHGNLFEVSRGKRETVAFMFDQSVKCEVLDSGKKLHMVWDPRAIPLFDPMTICILYPFNPMTVRGMLGFSNVDDIYVPKKRKTAQV